MTATKKSTIAVVDDDAEMRCGLERLLEAHGYEVELFASAEEFLAAKSSSQADCLALDIQLGSTSGLELGRRLLVAAVSLPIIFMTGSDDSSLRAQALKLGCVAYLYKPFPARALLEAITRALGRV